MTRFKRIKDMGSFRPGIVCWFADLPSKNLPAGVNMVFIVWWPEGWAGKDFQVAIGQPQPI